MIYFVTTLSVALCILASILFFTLKNGISPMPTSMKVRNNLLMHMPQLQQGKIVDLGSGWGNLLFPLSRHYTHCEVIGYENSPLPYIFSSLMNHQSNVKIVRGDFFEASLGDVDLIVCYLFPKGMHKLKSKLERELKPGTQIVTHTFAIPGWNPDKTVEVDDVYHTKIYVYTV